MDQELTEHEQRCFEHLKKARAVDETLVEYARAHGLQVRMLYDAAARLRKKGAIAGAVKPGERSRARSAAVADREKSPFVAVRIEAAKAQNFVPVLRLNHVQGHVLEFGSWPPADVMTTILTGGR